MNLQRTIFVSLAVLLVFTVQTKSLFAEELQKIKVFGTEEVDGIKYGYRIPSIITTQKGTLLAFAERRVGLHDHAQNDMVLKRSFNNGESWESMQIIADFGKNSLNDPLAVVLESSVAST